METAKKNFRRLMEYLQNRDDIELTTFSDLVARFGHQAETIDKARLAEIAGKVLEAGEAVVDPEYSPAETFAALASALTAYEAAGRVPEETECRRPFGPLQMPPREPGIEEVGGDQALELARRAHDVIGTSGHLPHVVTLDGGEIGTGSLLELFSRVYADILEGDLADTYAVGPFTPYPTENEAAIIENVRQCKGWPVHREDLDMSDLVEMTRLQMWTLKPALAR